MRKKKFVKCDDKRKFPLKVRLKKGNSFGQDKIIYNDIALYTFADTIINNVDELMKIQPLSKDLIMKLIVVKNFN